MTNRTEVRNEIEARPSVEVQTEQVQARLERHAESMVQDIKAQIDVCIDSEGRATLDHADLADMVYDFNREGCHTLLDIKSMKAQAEYFGKGNICSSESQLRDARDLGFVRTATPVDCTMPTSTQAGRNLKAGIKVGADHEDDATLIQRLWLFSELVDKHGEIKASKLAVDGEVCNATVETIEAHVEAEAEAEAEAKAPKTDAEKCEIQFMNFLNAVQKLSPEDGKAKIAECKARMKLADLEFAG